MADAAISVKMPANKKGEPVSLYYVGCQEKNNDKELCWHILTSEPVKRGKDAKRILGYYEKRWLIEEFHKAWKSGGTQVEALRMQSKDNLEKWLSSSLLLPFAYISYGISVSIKKKRKNKAVKLF